MKNIFEKLEMTPDNLTIAAVLSFILMAAVLKPSDRLRGVNASPTTCVGDTTTQTECLAMITPPAPPTLPAKPSPSPTKDKPFKPTYFTPSPERDKAAREYIKRFEKTAIEEMDRFNIPASITLGQGLLETAWGGSTLYKKANNHFGVKCFSKRCKKGHCMNREDDHWKDYFIIYKSAWESYRDHSKKISQGRYKHLPGKGFEAYAKGLKAAGYATDPKYAEKLIDIIKYYKLDKLDSL